MNSPELPDNDKDVQLARRLGKLLDAGQLGKQSLGQDEFAHLLDEFASSQASSVDPEVSRSMWDVIDSATRPGIEETSPGAKIFSLHSFARPIAVAASVLLVVIFGWYITRPSSSPILVAEAGDDTLVHQTADGSVISLRPHSSLYLVSQLSDRLEYKLEGEAQFVVTRDPARTFSVQAGVALVSVLGTTFNIINRDTLVSVYLEEGRIELQHLKKNQSQILDPGQAGYLSALTNISIDQAPNADEYMDWLGDEIRFRSKRLIEIIEEIEFHFSIAIDIPDERKEETLSGFLSLTSVDVALEKLSFTMGNGRFEQAGEQTYRFVPSE